ncbi:DUF5916 domain-containing protein [Gammaproteobacteria bacterium]|nr:DUF5916 domain-containing protein [Gammaproteobacteria bacterium]
MIKYLYILLASFPLLSEVISVDGSLDEPEWENAQVIDRFYEVSPYTLQERDESERTIALIFSNKDGIYVGFKNYQDSESMLSRKSMRDEMTSISEKNSINIDFDGDGSKAYIIVVSLADSLFDAIKVQSGDFKTDWDGDWVAKTKQYEGYWVSEIYLPWDMVLMNQPEGSKRKIKYSALRYIAKDQSWLSSAGTMAMRADYFEELDTLEIDNFTKSRLDFFPYLSANANTVTKAEENKVGTEIFYNTGKGQQFNLAINPDFGQAESDDVVINFSAQETFYSEKRAFFSENQSLFNISNYDRYSVINTRRIGSAPGYDCALKTDETNCNESKKNYSDIDFALRLTQKKNNSEVGFFAAQEKDEAYSLGKDYYAFRARTKKDDKTIGYMLTQVIDNFTNTTSTVNVFDYIQVRSDKLKLYTDLLASEKDNQSGLGFRTQFVYQPTKYSKTSGSILYFEDDFQLNDFGYLQRNDWFHIGLGADTKRIDFDEPSIILQIDSGIDVNYDSDTKGNSNPIRIDQRNEISFKDTSAFKLDFGFRSSGKNTTITRKDEIYSYVKVKNKVSITADYEAVNYKYWTYDWRVSFDRGDKYDTWDSKGNHKKFFKIAGSFFPNDFMKINTQLRIREESEWLNWKDSNNLATYDLSQKTISIDMNWFKGNKHEIRLKSQFVALEADNPRSLASDINGYLSQSNSEVKSFTKGIASFQLRYKYEIAPLSYLFVVYSKGGDDYEDETDRGTSSILKSPWENPSDELFSIKFRLKF